MYEYLDIVHIDLTLTIICLDIECLVGTYT